MSGPIITLTSDFGTRDGFVAAMKGVILSIVPDATLVDISHDIPPQDVQAGAFVLFMASRYYPAGTVHLAVVDPGVGSRRRSVIAVTSRHTFVGPDNGLFALIYQNESTVAVHEIHAPEYCRATISNTFHGRDIFAPVAAHLALGVSPGKMGPPLADPVQGDMPKPTSGPDWIRGHIIYVDHFGNLISNISTVLFQKVGRGRPFHLRLGKQTLSRLVTTYSDGPEGESVALLNSFDLLEVAVNRDSAQRKLCSKVGARVEIHFD